MAEDYEKKEPTTAPPAAPYSGKRGKVKIEIKVEFDLDDASVFDLKGEGIKTVNVVSN